MAGNAWESESWKSAFNRESIGVANSTSLDTDSNLTKGRLDNFSLNDFQLARFRYLHRFIGSIHSVSFVFCGFELLRTYPLCVALTAAHPFARLKSITLEKLAAEPLVGLRRKDYSEYYHVLDRIFAPIRAKPRMAVECDSASSLITEVEAGRGIALVTPSFKLVAGKRLLYRPLTGTTEVGTVGIARATKGDVTPAGEKFCEILRKISNGATAAKRASSSG